jgi:hypothetical protein
MKADCMGLVAILLRLLYVYASLFKPCARLENIQLEMDQRKKYYPFALRSFCRETAGLPRELMNAQ